MFIFSIKQWNVSILVFLKLTLLHSGGLSQNCTVPDLFQIKSYFNENEVRFSSIMTKYCALCSSVKTSNLPNIWRLVLISELCYAVFPNIFFDKSSIFIILIVKKYIFSCIAFFMKLFLKDIHRYVLHDSPSIKIVFKIGFIFTVWAGPMIFLTDCILMQRIFSDRTEVERNCLCSTLDFYMSYLISLNMIALVQSSMRWSYFSQL